MAGSSAGTRASGGSYAVQGIDAASYQGNVNWSQVANAGAKFADGTAVDIGRLNKITERINSNVSAQITQVEGNPLLALTAASFEEWLAGRSSSSRFTTCASVRLLSLSAPFLGCALKVICKGLLGRELASRNRLLLQFVLVLT